MQCLEMAHEDNYTSIALPALGTGKLSYPPEDVVAAIVTTVGCFLSTDEFKRSKLQTVILVVHEKDLKCIKVTQCYGIGLFL